MKIIVGIGNPGSEYRNTRHNAGFMAADAIAERLGAGFTKGKFQSLLSETRRGTETVMLMKPHTFVNLTGRSVAMAAGYFGAMASDFLLICDDMNLTTGKIRVRRAGSDGGHNGLKSVISALGTNEFNRVRIGIGRPRTGMDPADWVLSRFSSAEKELIASAVVESADAALAWLDEGIEACMNRHNG